MRVLLSTYGGRGSVEPMVGLAVRLRELDVEVLMCAPPDEEFVELLADAGVEMVPAGRPVRPVVTTVKPGSAVGLAQRAAELIAEQFGPVALAARKCDALVATGPLPVTAAARSVAEKLGIRYVHASHQPVSTPSPHQPPPARRGKALPPGVADNSELWDMDARNANEMFGAEINAQRAAIGLPPVDNVRDYAFTDEPWLATDPVLSPWPGRRRPTESGEPTEPMEPGESAGPEGRAGRTAPAWPGVVQTGAWIRPDDRPLSPELVEFLEAGTLPVYVGFGSMPLGGGASKVVARAAVEAIRAQGLRVVLARGWAGLEPIDGRDDCFVVGEVNQQALFARVAAVVHHGSAGTTTTAARAGVPQVVVPQGGDQPYWAERVADLGIGVAHDGPAPTPASLSAGLATVLAPEIRARARAVADTVRTDGATVAAKLLLDEVGRGRRGPLPE
ncbi:glycosyltransferase [Streptomyces sp. NBC_01077]|uniref:glycosyltransferase n=1 Tax=Streptomyces sp. NBC_01077 TaxID=2903746 RepID=UPI00386B4483|nr:glycosyltransferase [Streptomyces sp. NBC_01077]